MTTSFTMTAHGWRRAFLCSASFLLQPRASNRTCATSCSCSTQPSVVRQPRDMAVLLPTRVPAMSSKRHASNHRWTRVKALVMALVLVLVLELVMALVLVLELALALAQAQALALALALVLRARPSTDKAQRQLKSARRLAPTSAMLQVLSTPPLPRHTCSRYVVYTRFQPALPHTGAVCSCPAACLCTCTHAASTSATLASCGHCLVLERRAATPPASR